jgi:coproporphyrinogen III oxidase-like Fe-S oxidoreductase
MDEKECARGDLLCSSKHQMNAEFTAESVNSGIRSLVVDTIKGVPRGSLKSRLRDAARLLGLPVVRVRDYYYNRVRRIEAHEAFQILKRAEDVKRARFDKFDRMRLEYEARRLEMDNSAPSYLAWLLPPAVAPLPDLKGAAEVAETEPHD